MKQLALLLGLLIGMMLLVVWLQHGNLEPLLPQPSQIPSPYANEMQVKNIAVHVEIAKTQEQLARGLSGRESVKEDEGMLFVVKENSRPTFWMKDMQFPIDILWINDGKIVGFIEQAPTQGTTNVNDLPRYSPPDGIDYVLEVKAGFIKNNAIKVGDSIDLPKELQDEPP